MLEKCRRYGLEYWRVSLGGVFLTMAFAPFNMIILVVFAFYILLTETYGKDLWVVFKKGFVFGFVHFLTSLYWISIALTSKVGDFMHLVPLAIIGIPTILGFYSVLSTVVAAFVTRLCGWNKRIYWILFALAWTFFEWLRGRVPVVFPWNFVGFIVAGSDYTIKLAPLGVHFLSFLIVCYAGILTLHRRAFIVSTAFLAVVLVLLNVYKESTMSANGHSISIRIVQPNFDQHHDGNHARMMEVMEKLEVLSTEDIGEEVKLVIWPEGSYPYTFMGSADEIKYLSSIAPKGGYLIFGCDRRGEGGKIFNSMIAIGSDGKIHSIYDKNVLVPFGEYIPWRKALPLEKIVYSIGEFSIGDKYENNSGNILLGYLPLICFEGILSRRNDNFKWALNITNDAWFGDSSGPYQHLAMVRFRSVESGIPTMRVANTGVSVFIDSEGHFRCHIDLNKASRLDCNFYL